jgi:hypothetical protein
MWDQTIGPVNADHGACAKPRNQMGNLMGTVQFTASNQSASALTGVLVALNCYLEPYISSDSAFFGILHINE